MRAKRVLLAWEQGAGFGHTTQLSRLGRRLMAAGNEVVAAVRLLVVSAEEEVSEAVLAEEASVEEWAAEVVPVHDSSQFTTPTKT